LTAINKLWKTDIPSKIYMFGWRLLLNRLPTRVALNRRGILANRQDLSCELCSLFVEDNTHLFFSCNFIKGVWNDVFKWLGRNCLTGDEGCTHFLKFGELFNSKINVRVRHLIWLATAWNSWKLRNNVIFNGTTSEASSLIDDIKISSWMWFSSRYGRKCCTPFSSCCIDPLACF
jgi:hypothetical protein